MNPLPKLAACQTKCAATSCWCFDHRGGGGASNSKEAQPECRLTNGSAAVQASNAHFDAYVDASRPVPPPPPPHPPHPSSDGGASRYGCQGNWSSLPFCDTSKTPEARAATLIKMLTPEEKGSLMTARTTVRSNAIPRLGQSDNSVTSHPSYTHRESALVDTDGLICLPLEGGGNSSVSFLGAVARCPLHLLTCALRVTSSLPGRPSVVLLGAELCARLPADLDAVDRGRRDHHVPPGPWDGGDLEPDSHQAARQRVCNRGQSDNSVTSHPSC